MSGRTRRTKAEILADKEALANLNSEKALVKKKQDTESKGKSIIDVWYAINGDKILKKSKSAAGSVYSLYIGKKTEKEGKDFLAKIKKQGIRVEAI
jgi:hypothetical protein